MKYNFLFLIIFFFLTNLIHFFNERVVIIVFIIFVYFIVSLISRLFNEEFQNEFRTILHKANHYYKSIFWFLYYNMILLINFWRTIIRFRRVVRLVNKELSIIKKFGFLTNKN